MGFELLTFFQEAPLSFVPYTTLSVTCQVILYTFADNEIKDSEENRISVKTGRIEYAIRGKARSPGKWIYLLHFHNIDPAIRI